MPLRLTTAQFDFNETILQCSCLPAALLAHVGSAALLLLVKQALTACQVDSGPECVPDVSRMMIVRRHNQMHDEIVQHSFPPRVSFQIWGFPGFLWRARTFVSTSVFALLFGISRTLSWSESALSLLYLRDGIACCLAFFRLSQLAQLFAFC